MGLEGGGGRRMLRGERMTHGFRWLTVLYAALSVRQASSKAGQYSDVQSVFLEMSCGHRQGQKQRMPHMGSFRKLREPGQTACRRNVCAQAVLYAHTAHYDLLASGRSSRRPHRSVVVSWAAVKGVEIYSAPPVRIGHQNAQNMAPCFAACTSCQALTAC